MSHPVGDFIGSTTPRRQNQPLQPQVNAKRVDSWPIYTSSNMTMIQLYVPYTKEPSNIYLCWHLIGFHPLAHHPSSHNPRSCRPSFSHNDLITPSQQWVPLHNTAKSRLLHTFTTFVWDLLPPLSETASPYFWQITKNQTPQRFPSTTLCEARTMFSRLKRREFSK